MQLTNTGLKEISASTLKIKRKIRNDETNLKFNDFDLAWVKRKLFFQEKSRLRFAC